MKQNMAAKNIKSKQLQSGFTLIELLVVIGILAILLAITLIAINPARQFAQARDTSRRNAATQILNAIGGYFADNGGKLPTGLSGQTAGSFTLLNTTNYNTLCTQVIPAYMPALPRDPNIQTGADITNCAEAGWNTGYYLMRDANNRVTVSASGEIINSITVTR